MAATVAQLVSERSELANSLFGYYETVIDKVGTTPWYRPVVGKPNETEAVHVSRVAIPVRVLKKVLKPRRERFPGAEGGREEEARRGRWGNEYVDPRTAHFYEEPQADEDTEEVPWSRERKNSEARRVVVLGGPGGGKTFLSQLTAVELAEDGLAKLRDRRVPLDELPLPVWFDLESLADAAAVDDPAFESTAQVSAGQSDAVPWPASRFLALLRDNYGITGSLADWLSQPTDRSRILEQPLAQTAKLCRLATSRCWLILDALDQVTESKLPRLWKLLGAIETQKWECKVVLTCRTANYVKPPWKKITEYSLAPFGHSDIRKLITKWFGENNVRGRELQSAITMSYSLRHACRSPLLVTLACLVGGSQTWTISSRRGLYGAALDGLLRMLWHGQANKPSPAARQGIEVNVDDLVAVLRPMAWRLFSKEPESNRFSDDAVIDAIKTADRFELMTLKAAVIREELKWRGLIFVSGRKDNETQYSFLHKTFLEYLAAEHLCRVLREEDLREGGWNKAIVSWRSGFRVRVDLLVKKMAWLPSWQETLVMLTAALGEDKDQGKAAKMVDRMMELMFYGE
jgi:predicted NACHT family NTPase